MHSSAVIVKDSSSTTVYIQQARIANDPAQQARQGRCPGGEADRPTVPPSRAGLVGEAGASGLGLAQGCRHGRRHPPIDSWQQAHALPTAAAHVRLSRMPFGHHHSCSRAWVPRHTASCSRGAHPFRKAACKRAPDSPELTAAATARPPLLKMASLGGRVFKAYSTQLQRHPWRTQIVTTGALW